MIRKEKGEKGGREGHALVWIWTPSAEGLYIKVVISALELLEDKEPLGGGYNLAGDFKSLEACRSKGLWDPGNFLSLIHAPDTKWKFGFAVVLSHTLMSPHDLQTSQTSF